jgi:hypothetical protein
MNEEEYAADIIEVGFYTQVLTGGGYVGWNDNSNGLAFGGIHQTSAGVAGYVSGGGVLTSESDGVEWGYNAGGGVAIALGAGAGYLIDNYDGATDKRLSPVCESNSSDCGWFVVVTHASCSLSWVLFQRPACSTNCIDLTRIPRE